MPDRRVHGISSQIHFAAVEMTPYPLDETTGIKCPKIINKSENRIYLASFAAHAVHYTVDLPCAVHPALHEFAALFGELQHADSRTAGLPKQLGRRRIQRAHHRAIYAHRRDIKAAQR